MHFLIFLASK